jgi:hypothetical protein
LESAVDINRPRGGDTWNGTFLAADLTKRFAGAAALIALPSSWSSPAFGQSLRNDLKDLRWELHFDDGIAGGR